MPLALHAYLFDEDDQPPAVELVFYGQDADEAEEKMRAFLAEHPSLEALEKDFLLTENDVDEADVPEAQDFEEEEPDEEEETEGEEAT